MSANRFSTSWLAAVAFALVAAMVAPPLHAQTCTVPGSHATVQEAADDPACVTIDLAAQTYSESVVLRRSLTVAGPAAGGAVIQGLVLVSGPTTVATLQDLTVENGCVPDAVRASGGAHLVGENIQVERADGLPCPLTADTIFVDGFETGNTGAWSSTSP
jgi:hypothetical protein